LDIRKSTNLSGNSCIVKTRVKPSRDKIKSKRPREKWWLFEHYGKGFRKAIEGLDRILARAIVSETHAIEFVSKKWIFSHKVVLFAFNDYFHFALLQSNLHELWMRQFTSTMRTDTNYSPSDCFETFPFPQNNLNSKIQLTEKIGCEYCDHRQQTMIVRQKGLTEIYNLFDEPSCTDADIQQLRDLHAAMDNAVLACYGWQDVQLNHNFYQNERGQTRFTIAPEARIELLNRLLELNLSIAEQEQLGETEDEEETET